MAERLEPILPQVPVEGIAVHIGRARLCMGDAVRATLLPQGKVGIVGRVRRPILGFIPAWRETYLGHLGPLAESILAPALAEGVGLRLRVVQLTPEHLATSGPPEIHVSVWGDPRLLAPFLSLQDHFLPPPDFHAASAPDHLAAEDTPQDPSPDPSGDEAFRAA
ncbi:hypothetical protein [Pseudogemmobacter sonorensis]|uniref:hypothetical protein n=1 Tax=Pseudogemmobacter sonorensis TaxID=2989681 RepID=UPI0036CC5C83